MNLIPKNDVIHTNRNNSSGWYMISVDEYNRVVLEIENYQNSKKKREKK